MQSSLWQAVLGEIELSVSRGKIQPELKKIKKAAKGDKRKEQTMMMELYKERGINPFGQIGVMIIQIPILLGLYIGLQKVLKNPEALTTFAYPFLRDFGWLKELAHNIHQFDATLFGFVDLTRSAASSKTGTYWPALTIVTASAVTQYFTSKQLTPSDKNSKGLRQILREAKTGDKADQAEVNAAMGRSTRILLPVMVFFFTVHIASALSLYWLVSGVVAFIQQKIILSEDVEEMEVATDKAAAREQKAVEAEIVAVAPQPKAKKKPAKTKTTSRNKQKRRK